MWYQGLLDRGLVPDALIRTAIRRRCADRLRRETRAEPAAAKAAFVAQLKTLPVAVHTDDANVQHYELPPAFFDALDQRLAARGYHPRMHAAP